MTAHNYTELHQEGREEMFKTALGQLEQQLFEAELNKLIVPAHLHDQKNESGESLNSKIARLVGSIRKLQDSRTELVERPPVRSSSD